MCSNFFDVVSYSPKALQLILLLSVLFFVGLEKLAANSEELTVKFQQGFREGTATIEED